MRLPLPWLLFAVVAAVWFPVDPWWQSDDLIAVHYASDPARALHDFTGNQYGLTGVVRFWRPLITASFALEGLLGADPLVSHLSNTLAHALNACLVGLLASRFIGPRRGFVAGLVWATAPLHAAAVFWAVGRVDSHTAVWTFLALVLAVRAFDRGRTPWLGLVPFVFALASKESAVAVPGAVALLGFATAEPGTRLARAARSWPFFVVLAAYFAWRFHLFGRIGGGYTAADFDIVTALHGRLANLLTAVNPLRIGGLEAFGLPAAAVHLGWLPGGLALLVLLVRRRFGALALGAAAFVGLALPAVQVWSLTGVETLRYDYVPFAVVALGIAAAGELPAVLALLVHALPFLDLRREYQEVWRTESLMHERLVEEAEHLPAENWFVAGLPVESPRYGLVALHLGVDRILRPPIADVAPRTVRALRPLDRPDAWTIPFGERRGVPFADSATLAFDGPEILATLPPPAVTELSVELDGPETIATGELLAIEAGEERRILVRPVRSAWYRVTLFTAGGYMTVFVPDRAPEEERTGWIDLRDLLHARYARGPGPDRAHVAFALAVATALDRVPRFPLLIEAGTGPPHAFRATAANREPLWIRFDADYARFIEGS